MGASGEDCFHLGELIGYKVFISEVVAYKEMLCMYENETIGDRTLHIAIYALCGFSSFGAIGVQIASMVPLAPGRKKCIIDAAFRAMLGGNIACFTTACIAGILIDQLPFDDFDIECS